MNSLPIGSTIKETFSTLFTRYRHFFRLALPLFVSTLLIILPFVVLGTMEINNEGLFSVYFIVGVAFYFATLIMTVTGFHRVFLQSDAEVETTKSFRWGMNETRNLGYYILGLICAIVFGLILAFVWMIIFGNNHDPQGTLQLVFDLITNILIFYVISRFSLVIPACATGERVSLLWAWSLSKGNSLRLALLVGGLPALVTLLLPYIAVYTNEVITLFATPLIVAVLYTVEIGLLSYTYKWLIENQGEHMAEWTDIQLIALKEKS